MATARIEDIKHVGFDVDGTLYCYALHEGIFAAECEAVQRAVAEETGFPLEAVIEHYVREYKRYLSHSDVVSKSFNLPSSLSRIALSTVGREGYLGRDEKLIKLFDSLDRGGKSYSFYSNSDPSSVRLVLAAIGVPASRFEFSISGKRFPKENENVGGFEEIVRHSRCEPAQVLYVGDRKHKDIAPAKRAGLQTALVAWNGDIESQPCEVEPTYLLPDIYTLGTLLKLT